MRVRHMRVSPRRLEGTPIPQDRLPLATSCPQPGIAGARGRATGAKCAIDKDICGCVHRFHTRVDIQRQLSSEPHRQQGAVPRLTMPQHSAAAKGAAGSLVPRIAGSRQDIHRH